MPMKKGEWHRVRGKLVRRPASETMANSRRITGASPTDDFWKRLEAAAKELDVTPSALLRTLGILRYGN